MGLALVCSFGTASSTPFVYVAGSYLYCWIIPILDQCCTTKAHRAVIFAIAQLSCIKVIAVGGAVDLAISFAIKRARLRRSALYKFCIDCIELLTRTAVGADVVVRDGTESVGNGK